MGPERSVTRTPTARPAFDNDAFDVLCDADLSALVAYVLFNHACDLAAAAVGEPCAVHVVADDHRVGDERAARGFDPVVAPLCGEECAQGGVVEAALHVVLRSLERAAFQ